MLVSPDWIAPVSAVLTSARVCDGYGLRTLKGSDALQYHIINQPSTVKPSASGLCTTSLLILSHESTAQCCNMPHDAIHCRVADSDIQPTASEANFEAGHVIDV